MGKEGEEGEEGEEGGVKCDVFDCTSLMGARCFSFGTSFNGRIESSPMMEDILTGERLDSQRGVESADDRKQSSGSDYLAFSLREESPGHFCVILQADLPRGLRRRFAARSRRRV